MGEARADFAVVHNHCQYDLELTATRPVEELVSLTLSAWEKRTPPSAFERMAGRRRAGGAS
jgi:hypothetical protein